MFWGIPRNLLWLVSKPGYHVGIPNGESLEKGLNIQLASLFVEAMFQQSRQFVGPGVQVHDHLRMASAGLELMGQNFGLRCGIGSSGAHVLCTLVKVVNFYKTNDQEIITCSGQLPKQESSETGPSIPKAR